MKESSPGKNGLSIAFFKKFFPLFGHFFVEILNDSENILPDAFNETKEMIPRLVPKSESIEKEVKSSIYADDTEEILRSKESIDPFFEEFKSWGEISGATLNGDKTKILAINSLFGSHGQIKFVDNLKILGNNFDKNGVAMSIVFGEYEICANTMRQRKIS